MTEKTAEQMAEELANYDGLISFAAINPLTVDFFVLAPAMRPFRPVMRFAYWKFGGVGEYQIFNQVYHHDGDKAFSVSAIRRVIFDAEYEDKTSFEVALEYYSKYLQVFYSHIALAHKRGPEYGIWNIPRAKMNEANQMIIGGDF